jgi:hypothetical protein
MRFSLVSQIGHELRSFWSGYPEYVYSGGGPAEHVPVFVYHTIRPSRFKADLRYLQENGYRTIGMEDLRKHLAGERRAPERSVVLTFDDARSSFWRFGFPLLRRYGMKGVLFVISGLTPTASATRPNLCSVRNSNKTIDDIRAIDPDDTTLCTWPELSEMYESGYVEVESHSLFHKEVFVDTEILDFLGPDSSFVPFNTSATAYLSAGDAGQPLVPNEYYGLPLFQTAPLHAGERAWEASGDLIRFARDQWEKLSSEKVEDGEWKRFLRTQLKQHDYASGLRRQSVSELKNEITDDIAGSRALIKENVDADAGNHFCLPYTVGSELSLCVMETLDVESCCWGVLPEDRHNAPGTTPMKISRAKSDFLWRLPGRGQKSLLRIYVEKIRRRLRGDRVF